MRHLAANADRGAVSARELAEAYDLPPELLAKVLQKLVRARLLTSLQGIRGGYGLARPAGVDFGGRCDSGHRRSADGDGVFRDEPQLRPVLEVQHPRSALADQGPDRRRRWPRRRSRISRPIAAGDCAHRRRAGVPVTVAEENMITVTDNAAAQILKLIEKQHQDATGLRVGVKAGGCSGFEYVFEWEPAPRDTRPGVRRPAGRARVDRSAQPSPARRHDARLRHEPDQPRLRVPEPARQEHVRLRDVFYGLSKTPMSTFTETIEQLASREYQVRLRDRSSRPTPFRPASTSRSSAGCRRSRTSPSGCSSSG